MKCFLSTIRISRFEIYFSKLFLFYFLENWTCERLPLNESSISFKTPTISPDWRSYTAGPVGAFSNANLGAREGNCLPVWARTFLTFVTTDNSSVGLAAKKNINKYQLNYKNLNDIQKNGNLVSKLFFCRSRIIFWNKFFRFCFLTVLMAFHEKQKTQILFQNKIRKLKNNNYKSNLIYLHLLMKYEF